MFFRPRLLVTSLLLASALTLAGCESAEDKAERYYQSGLSFLEAGDVDRAKVELRNVFEYNGFHKEARRTFAEILMDEGDVGGAYSQYLRLAEQYPEEADVRIILAEIALSRGDWAEVERHGKAATELDPAQPRARALAAALSYRAALEAEDTAAAAESAEAARLILEEMPDNMVARRIVIDAGMKSETPDAALDDVEAALAQEPESLEFHVAKLRLLAQAEDEPGTVAQLEVMFELFPDNEEVRTNLINYYLSQQDFDRAETLLRKLAGEDTAETPGHVTVVQFLQAARGAEAATAELERLIAANDGTANADLYRAMKAALDFEGGAQDAAITDMQAIIAAATPSDQTRQIKVILARMLGTTGNQVGARALVEEILAEDTSNVDALKMRAAWLISDDDPDAAVNDLRAALNQAPRDAEILTLMAEAHERAGSPELAGERLALAVEVSGSAPAEAMRYAQFLLRDERTAAAETVLLDARRANPGNLELISRLADLYLSQQNWTSARLLEGDLRTLAESPDITPEQAEQAGQVATALEAAILMGQNQTDESLKILQEQLGNTDEGGRTTITVVLAQIRSGKLDEARTYLDEALAKSPDDLTLRLLSGSLHMIASQPEEAEAIFVKVLEEAPETEAATRLLYSLRVVQGRTEEANAVLDAGIAAAPDAASLLWIKAGALEQAGDTDGAIAIYEDLYAADSSNVIVANNLASMITTYRNDPADLDRAFAIARRLRGMEVPAFQDTYGWIESRRGNYEDALAYLEPAAAGLPEEALVHFHLGMTYAALERRDEAIASLKRALELAEPNPVTAALPQIATARETLASLEAAAPEAPADGTATDGESTGESTGDN